MTPRPPGQRRRRPAGRARVLVVLAATVLLLDACARPAPPPIVWIVVDTLRADHLPSYGYGRPTAPAIARVAASGTLFEQARTPHPETSPAIASMLTGLYPARHGVRALYQLLHDRNRTAAELLAARGYDTAAFVSSFVMIRHFSHLDQGFGLYDDFVHERERYRESYERRAAETLALAGDWVRDRRSDRPFFLFVHLIDPHGPYTPPPPFDTRFRSTSAVAVQGEIPPANQIPGVRDLNRYRDLYDGEIAYADQSLGRFLDALRARGLYDRALIVITADHGESMGEHGLYFRHGDDVFEENLHVPLVVKPPAGSGAPTGQRLAQPVSLVDLLPTVLDFAGAAAPSGLDGRSLLPLLRGVRSEPRPVFAGTAGPMRYAALLAAGRKTVLRADGRRVVVVSYDLASDPAERAPLRAEWRAARQLRQWRRACLEQRPPFAVRDNFMAPELRGQFVDGRRDARAREDEQRLRSLGYVR